ncbi:MAG: CapA family protein, partial [Candidatus Thorarchaeota archaeon]
DTNYEPRYIHVANKEDFANVKSKISHEKNRSNLIVVQCHWGDEFITIPNAEQIQMANELVESGVDIIIGHHSHVYQGLRTINERPVFFSLGNFVSDMNESYLRRSAIGSILWDGSKLTTTILPLRLNENHQPYLSSENRDKAFIESIDKQLTITESINYSTIYQQSLHRARRRYRIDTLLNLIRNLGILPKYKAHQMVGIIRKMTSN